MSPVMHCAKSCSNFSSPSSCAVAVAAMPMAPKPGKRPVEPSREPRNCLFSLFNPQMRLKTPSKTPLKASFRADFQRFEASSLQLLRMASQELLQEVRHGLLRAADELHRLVRLRRQQAQAVQQLRQGREAPGDLPKSSWKCLKHPRTAPAAARRPPCRPGGAPGTSARWRCRSARGSASAGRSPGAPGLRSLHESQS